MIDGQMRLESVELTLDVPPCSNFSESSKRSEELEQIMGPADDPGAADDPGNVERSNGLEAIRNNIYRTAELFKGTGSFSKIAEKRGYKTFTVDIVRSFNPDLCEDILCVDAADIPGPLKILWASPPCQAFSVAAIGSSWCGKDKNDKPMYHPKRVETALGMAWVLKTLKLIKELKPEFWFIENPRGCMRKMAFMEGLHRNTVTYCQYGDTRMKPTDIWTNLLEWKPRPVCKNGDPCHEAAPRGSKTGTQGIDGAKNRGRIPPQLFEEIFDVIEDRGSIPGHNEKTEIKENG